MNWSEAEIWDDNNNLSPDARPYVKSATILKLNHPLMIMVEEKRTVNWPRLNILSYICATHICV